MMDQTAAWWRARTTRERLLLQASAILAFGVLLPLSAFQTANAYRVEARAALQDAQGLAADVKRIAAASAQGAPPMPENDGTVRGIAFAAAQAHGLTVARVEPAGPDRVKIAFTPAQSVLVYRWFDTVTRRGLFISASSMTRAGEGGLVTAEFDVARSQ
jgi:type II secretory pathway component PulM